MKLLALPSQLNAENVRVVAEFMKGKRREKFLASVSIMNESLAKGGWVSRGAVKARSGFYQGLGPRLAHVSDRSTVNGLAASVLATCVNFGIGFDRKFDAPAFDYFSDEISDDKAAFQAWADLCREFSYLFAELGKRRPAPVITPIGLSPRVTDTLKNMNLDLDIQSVRMPDIEVVELPQLDSQGAPVLGKDGKPVVTRSLLIKWAKGCRFGLSRFAEVGGHCHACGKLIPSRRFVPMEAMDLKLGTYVALLLGEDCARNIFGVAASGVRDTDVVDSLNLEGFA